MQNRKMAELVKQSPVKFRTMNKFRNSRSMADLKPTQSLLFKVKKPELPKPKQATPIETPLLTPSNS